VFIAYLLAYYEDGGDIYSDYGHHGDSEGIYLKVYYNDATQHWVLDEANYSQHTGYGIYVRAGSAAYPTDLDYAEWPLGGYPTVWVSDQKHANYKSMDECNGGAFGHTDTCNHNNAWVRVETQLPGNWGSGNIGSAAVPTLPVCVRSFYHYYNSREECFWSATTRFRGWAPPGGADADPYYRKLDRFGFIPHTMPAINLTGPTQMGPRDYCWWYATAQFGTPPYTYDWQNGGFVETIDGTSRYGNGGPIWITVWVTDADGRVEYANTQADVDENMNGCN
jgi:hypothetical protein